MNRAIMLISAIPIIASGLNLFMMLPPFLKTIEMDIYALGERRQDWSTDCFHRSTASLLYKSYYRGYFEDWEERISDADIRKRDSKIVVKHRFLSCFYD